MKKEIGLYVLCFLLLVFCAVLGLWYRSEGFANKAKKVPSYCGTAGYAIKNITNRKAIDPVRHYTKSGCDALKGVLRNGDECLKLRKKPVNKKKPKKNKKHKKGEEEEDIEEEDEDAPIQIDEKNIKLNYSTACAGLNHKPSPPPIECAGVGKANVPFQMTFNGKKIKVPANTFIVYTQDECETQLQGIFSTFDTDDLWAGAPKKEINKAMKLNGGTEIGLCRAADATMPHFSFACTGETNVASVSGASSAFSSMLQYIKSFL